MDPDSKRVYVSQNIQFFEKKSRDTHVPYHEKNEFESTLSIQSNEWSDSSQQLSTLLPCEQIQAAREEKEAPAKYRELREIYNSCSFALLVADPVTYNDAAKDQEWITALNEELEAIRRNETWELVELPKNRKEIGPKWVFKSKLNVDGTLLRRKAHLVAKVFSQHEGIDLEEIFSPIARLESVRLFLAIIAQREWTIYHLDVKMAFLNGEHKEEVFVSQPKGYVIKGREDDVYQLHKTLYGL
ncbi:uncharacterized mitochondrial protein AtMg00820-like [Dioscorea cayenensis subsp. rotundata]|uniref:Uncharacterized mitochondrial protein AtMg00820-like n=1 Tax=Dioscorea cayennensis subsp. rotundata TaxID=55577 RepID=A0AB40BNI9_DIOCR|nr:uncharacterized mitochondrial protein AtMg00820-like [Dioscorea cayenensis subsp. rotundata]